MWHIKIYVIVVDFLATFIHFLIPFVTLSLSKSSIRSAVVFIVFIILVLVCQYSASCLIVFSASFVSCSRCYWDFFHDNSYLSIEYNNWVPLIDLTVSINTSSRRTYRKRYNFNIYNFKINIIYIDVWPIANRITTWLGPVHPGIPIK